MLATVSGILLLAVTGASDPAAPEPGERPAAAAEQCSFNEPPDVAFYWEPSCHLAMPGCWADSAHLECRFCGRAPYTGIPCPDEAQPLVPQTSELSRAASPTSAPQVAEAEFVATTGNRCNFTHQPAVEYYWEPLCQMGMLGCFADGIHMQCRFCGGMDFSGIRCRPLPCTFPNEPRTPYYWDDSCDMHTEGCNADGAHVECRFCVKKPFDTVSCPDSLKVTPGVCSFPGSPPVTPYFWDPTCDFGKLGCWADGLHAECRWCGVGAYKDVKCPP